VRSPSRKRNLKRRTFLGVGLAAAAGGAAISCRRGGGGADWRFFTAGEARAVDAICECLIPADGDAGAHQADVVNYIDIQLTKSFKKHQRSYRQGIATVDDTSRRRFGKSFVDLAPGQQADVLAEVEKNARAFFQLILAHTQQGFYGDPRHGGNRQRVSWKMVGLSYPPIRGRQQYDSQETIG
jgi:gluconate 2-dehydrogenase gamma chain